MLCSLSVNFIQRCEISINDAWADLKSDVARLYADGKLLADNFYNGRPFLLGLWRLPEECTRLELRILALQEDMPVYFPREAGEPGEEVYDKTIFSPASCSMPRK